MRNAWIEPGRATLLGSLLLSVCGLTACAGRPPGPGGRPLPKPTATAKLTDSSGKQVGLAIFTATDTGTSVGLSVGGLAPGLHGLQVHATGQCAPPDFSSAGPRLRDLPDLLVQADGSADTTFPLDPALLRPGPSSLLRPEGTAIVVHAEAGDQSSEPSDGSGDRIACGTIEPD
ncbi:MAG TPA: superoxide dismutase family protein [Gemmatimonadales bacterium]|jgi:Cu-Zn family superoxide dismutase|nr:superoxide dismutase family protein [Gemmatimonadales bacterium]